MRGLRCILAIIFLFAALPAAFAQTQINPAVVRLSYVQGKVSIEQGGQTQFDQAQANMPLLAGYTLSTGGDGQAEIEFTDGSVARLTPQSRMTLIQLAANGTSAETTEVELLSGLGYFELNTRYGQQYRVRFKDAVVNPEQNSIFRIDLDTTPELAVFTGTVHAKVDGGFDQSLAHGTMLQLGNGSSGVQVSSMLRQETWDQWNQDRDDEIAREARQQTDARASSGAQNEPGWDDLDYYGNWYPMQSYGNVWVPNGQPQGWDPYANGYWANYPDWGYTWISAYPWGWLPYHCGAWNYWGGFGWGWVPGQCGLGWQTQVIIWNKPLGFRPPRRPLPPRPIPGGHAGPASSASQLIAVRRGPALPFRPGPIGSHTEPIRVGGQQLHPLPVLGASASGRLPYRSPAGIMGLTGGAYRSGASVPLTVRSYTYSGSGITPLAGGVQTAPRIAPGVVAPNPVISRPMPVQPPRVIAAPRPVSPMPRISAPPSAPHLGPIGHH
jgi:FecR protein